MISGVQNVGFQGINASTNAAPYMTAQYQYQMPQMSGDVVDISTKKSGVKKGIIGALATVAALAVGLCAAVRTGKLTQIADPKSIMDKAKNLAYAGGSKVSQGYDYVAKLVSPLVDKVKGLFGKKGADAAENTVA